eukprot:TRINITY_DN1851_c2_g1_i1.p1 TRINITY_DN1851_c2_g1~~TRINITY_DN1851_c2_g1_i1.p1  ORF type:complete len:708 (+),score=88.88 TRINITY_DN1851_c2_g1_i1:57-2126(+)
MIQNKVIYLLLPLVLFPVFWSLNNKVIDGNVVVVSTAETEKVKKELDETRRSVEELGREMRNLKEKTLEIESTQKRSQSTPALPSRDYDGTIQISSAVLQSNCPSIESTNIITNIQSKYNNDAYTQTYPKVPSMPPGYADLSKHFQSKCNGKEKTCSVKAPGDRVAGLNKLVIEYQCGSSDILREVRHEVKPGETEITLKCSTQKAATRKTVKNISPVRYRHQNRDFELWPIGFSVPGHRYVGSVSWKERHFADLIPSNTATYIHKGKVGTEGKAEPDHEYFSNYKHSFYCVTRKKKGWDALRHYEILSSGCVPYFIDIDRMPSNTMAFFPKDLVSQAMRLPGVTFVDDHNGSFNKKNSFIIDESRFNKTDYFRLASKIQAHARKYLTSEAMASYILEALTASGGPTNPQKVLFISHCYPDFMGDSLWSGFKELELMGKLEKVDDIVPPKGNAVSEYWVKMYGNCNKGRKTALMTSVKTMKKEEFYSGAGGWGNHRTHNEFESSAVDHEDIPKRILRKEYDAVIYATPTRTMAWSDEVTQAYKPHEVVLLHGGDDPTPIDVYESHSRIGTVFVREIYDDGYVTNEKICSAAPGIAEIQGHDCCLMADGPLSIVWNQSFPSSETWVHCAKEAGECQCDTVVRFGTPKETRWSVYDMKMAGKSSVKCVNRIGNGVFPDPAVGKPKTCQCKK